MTPYLNAIKCISLITKQPFYEEAEIAYLASLWKKSSFTLEDKVYAYSRAAPAYERMSFHLWEHVVTYYAEDYYWCEDKTIFVFQNCLVPGLQFHCADRHPDYQNKPLSFSGWTRISPSFEGRLFREYWTHDDMWNGEVEGEIKSWVVTWLDPERTLGRQGLQASYRHHIEGLHNFRY